MGNYAVKYRNAVDNEFKEFKERHPGYFPDHLNSVDSNVLESILKLVFISGFGKGAEFEHKELDELYKKFRKIDIKIALVIGMVVGGAITVLTFTLPKLFY